MENLNNILKNDWDSIEGWCTREKALKMIEYIKPNTQCCVELGVFGGKSLLPIALFCKNRVIGIDAWDCQNTLEGQNDIENDKWWSKIDFDKMYIYTQNLMKKYNCSNVELLRTTSEKAVVDFSDDSIDFLHQDSNHSEEISCKEVELYAKKVIIGGIWVFDDTNWNTTLKAQSLLIDYGYIKIHHATTWAVYQRIQ
jgi:hypothetical protein